MIRASPPLGLALLLCAACAGPVVEARTHERFSRPLGRVAVAPFVAAPTFRGSPEAGAPSAEEAAELVARFVSEAFEAGGLDVVPPADVELAVESLAPGAMPEGPAELAALAAERFGAGALLFGEVYRFVERRGEALGAQRPASVAFGLALYTAPEARRLWTARFDETQAALSADFFRARRYPGGGTRWLSAAELTRWGAGHAADAVRELP